MHAGRTARDRARAQVSAEIRDVARRQLAVTGGEGLSLRAVARELGMVSSALYRYFANRDELLTALILDAYGALADAAQAGDAAAAPGDFRARWRRCATAVREWALAHRQEYTLLYGSPVTGYHAPRDTVAPAVRVYAVLAAPVADAAAAGALGPPAASVPGVPPELAAQLPAVRDEIAPAVDDATLTALLLAVTGLFGMLNFELFGQFTGGIDPADTLFATTVEHTANLVGLPPEPHHSR